MSREGRSGLAGSGIPAPPEPLRAVARLADDRAGATVRVDQGLLRTGGEANRR